MKNTMIGKALLLTVVLCFIAYASGTGILSGGLCETRNAVNISVSNAISPESNGAAYNGITLAKALENISFARGEQLMQSYGYILGQYYTLQSIKDTHHQLLHDVASVTATFETSPFGAGAQELERILERDAGDSWPSIQGRLNDTMQESFKTQKMSWEDAKLFLNEVSERAKGNMHEEVRATLLTVNPRYSRSPELEMIDGWRQEYCTNGHPKAKGIDFSISLPLSWSHREGHRPNVVQFFQSQYGNGPVMCSLVVLAIPEESASSEEDMAEAFHPDALRLMLPAGATFVSATSITMEAQPAGLLVYDLAQQQIDQTLSMRMTQFMTIQEDSIIQIGFMVSPQRAPNKTLDELQDHYFPLFRLIANSYVPHGRYIQ